MLRNDVVSSVMMVNPIIRSVHGGTEASPIERYALPSFVFILSRVKANLVHQAIYYPI